MRALPQNEFSRKYPGYHLSYEVFAERIVDFTAIHFPALNKALLKFNLYLKYTAVRRR